MPQNQRLRLFDTLRGLSVVSMVLFHFAYDLKYIVGLSLPWFAPPLQDVWRASISWVFLLVAGCMCSLSRNNLRRGLQYAAVAGIIYVVTTVVAVDDPISFGIIYCMAACTLCEWIMERLDVAPVGTTASVLLFVLFVLCLNLPRGQVGIGSLTIPLPRAAYQSSWLAWLGFPGPTFVSGDYYPLLPYLLLYLCGSSLGWQWKRTKYPPLCSSMGFAPLEAVGRHALAVYVAHQPVLLLLSMALGAWAGAPVHAL